MPAGLSRDEVDPGRARARSIGWILGFLAVVLGPRFVGIPRRRPSFRPAGGPPAGDADPLTRTSAAAAPLHRHQSTPAGRPAAREGDASHATTTVPLELQCARAGQAGGINGAAHEGFELCRSQSHLVMSHPLVTTRGGGFFIFIFLYFYFLQKYIFGL